MNRIVFRVFGPPAEVVALEPFGLPPLKEGEVRVKMRAAPINPADLNTLEGNYGDLPELPATPGMEGMGEVEESRAEDFAAGDPVIFLRRAESWSTHVQVSAAHLLKLPHGIDPLQAAMLKVNPATAMRLLHGFAKLPKGAWVAQNAANSAVGRCVIQLAHAQGLRTINFVRRAEVSHELHALGADLVLLDDSQGPAAALEATGGERPHLACNGVGGDSALRLMDLLGERGVHVTYGAMSRRSLKVPNAFLIFKRIELHGLWVSRWLAEAPAGQVRETYQELAELVAAGRLVQAVDSVYPLAACADAIRRAQEGGRNGKVLLEMQ